MHNQVSHLTQHKFLPKLSLRTKKGRLDKCHIYRISASSGGETAFDSFARSASSASKEATKRFKKAYIVVEENVKRTAAQVNAKYDVSGKAQQAAEQVSEQAKEVDRRVGVKRRLRNVADDFQRRLPAWQKQYREFSKTSFGQATFLAGVFLLFYTGIAFKILNLVFILWWLAPFLFLIISKVNPQAKERQKAAREAQAQKQRQFFQSAFFNNAYRQQRPNAQQTDKNRRTYYDPKSEVIDVEYTTIDEH